MGWVEVPHTCFTPRRDELELKPAGSIWECDTCGKRLRLKRNFIFGPYLAPLEEGEGNAVSEEHSGESPVRHAGQQEVPDRNQMVLPGMSEDLGPEGESRL